MAQAAAEAEKGPKKAGRQQAAAATKLSEEEMDRVLAEMREEYHRKNMAEAEREFQSECFLKDCDTVVYGYADEDEGAGGKKGG